MKRLWIAVALISVTLALQLDDGLELAVLGRRVLHPYYPTVMAVAATTKDNDDDEQHLAVECNNYESHRGRLIALLVTTTD